MVGVGQDNEPLLRNVVAVGKVARSLLAIDWRALKDAEDIQDLRDRLTRITDPIGRNIIQRDLDRLLERA